MASIVANLETDGRGTESKSCERPDPLSEILPEAFLGR
jgi:hypothetical protein